MQNHIGQHFSPHHNLPVVVVVDQPEFSKLTEKMQDSRGRGAHQVRQSFIIQLGQFGIWQKVLLAVTTQLQQDTGQAFLGLVKKLIAGRNRRARLD
jgi:hypothetical protein